MPQAGRTATSPGGTAAQGFAKIPAVGRHLLGWASLPYGLRIAALSSFLKAVVDRRPASIICRLIVDTRTYTKLNGAPDDIFCVNGGPTSGPRRRRPRQGDIRSSRLRHEAPLPGVISADSLVLAAATRRGNARVVTIVP